MSTIKHLFNQDDLNRLIDNRLSFYRATEASGSKLGAVEYVSVDTPVQMLHAFADKVAQGYTLHESYPVSAQTMNGIGLYSFYVTRPQHMQEADIAVITEQVTAEYNEHRRELFEAHKKQIVADSLAMAKRAEAKKAAEAEAKLLARLEKEAAEALGTFE